MCIMFEPRHTGNYEFSISRSYTSTHEILATKAEKLLKNLIYCRVLLNRIVY